MNGWARTLKEEFPPYVWRSQAEINANKICKIIRKRCNDIERQNVFSNRSEKIPLVLYGWEVKHG
jgi:hypothetical protein